MNWDAFFTLHDGLPREGPGDAGTLRWAVACAGVPDGARILDAGCGPGGDIGDLLAAVPGAQVLALDTHAPFVEAARERYAGVPRVEVRQGDMASPPGTFDLIWCAGALYFLGIEAGLRGWRGALRPGGAVAFSEPVWFGADRPEAARRFWEREYPVMTDEAGLRAQVAEAGYEVLGSRPVSDAGREAYFGPIDARIAELRARGADAALAQVLDEAEEEAAVWRAHGDAFGYLVAVVRPA